MRVRWSQTAEATYEAWLEYLDEAAPQVRERAQADVEFEMQRLVRHPGIARLSRWSGYREWSLLRWRKIVLVRIEREEILVAAFIDTRQDLSQLPPKDD